MMNDVVFSGGIWLKPLTCLLPMFNLRKRLITPGKTGRAEQDVLQLKKMFSFLFC